MLRTPICCFRPTDDDYGDREILQPDDGYNKKLAASAATSSPRSPYAWLKSTAQDLEIKDKCRGLIGRRGKGGQQRQRRQTSAEFSYDAESYSLNFEDEFNKEDEVALHDFVARLPATPNRLPENAPPVAAVRAPREVYAWI